MELTIEYPGGRLILNDDMDGFDVDGDVDEETIRMANKLISNYRYSPSEGYPGYYACEYIARKTGGKAVLPPVPELPPGAKA